MIRFRDLGGREAAEAAPGGNGRQAQLRRGISRSRNLVAGRMLLPTCRPIRFQADVRAQTEFRAVLRDAREHFRAQIELARQVVEWMQQRSAPDNRSGAGPTVSKSGPPR
jgi:hypothetical protein